MESCVFCNVVGGKTPSHIVFKDNVSLAFLDRRPLFLGHCLLIPLDHHETIENLLDNLIGQLFSNAKYLSTAVQKATNADGTFIAINNRVSQSVPHLHIHIVPRRAKDGLRGFFWPRQKYESNQAASDMQQAIRKELSKET